MNIRVFALTMVAVGILASGCACGDEDKAPADSQENHRSTMEKRTSKDDVSCIGSREVGGRGFTNWYSLDYEIRLGAQWSKVVESRLKLFHDPPVTDYVNRVAQLLVRNSDAKVAFTVKVIDDTGGINTFALPGGYLYVSSGLIIAADSEAEFAAVLAHEIAHVAAHHAVRQITRENLSQIATTPLALVAGPFGQVIRAGASLAIPMSMSKFSRGFETEADYLGVQYMYKAGYDPHAFLSFIERASGRQHKAGALRKAFAMYPKERERIRQGEAEIENILPVREEYIVSTSDFDAVKVYLQRGRQGPKLNDKSHMGPLLRRPEPEYRSSADTVEMPIGVPNGIH